MTTKRRAATSARAEASGRPSLLLFALLAGACAAPPAPRPAPPGAHPAVGSVYRDSVYWGSAPWEVPPEELASQRLFRVHYDGPEGEGSFRLTLRLADLGRYRATAVDLAGRSLWTLSVEGEEGLWLDHRQEVFCSFAGGLEVEGLPLGVSLPTLPAVLLGRVPAPPAARPPRPGERFEYRDVRGRRWSGRLAGGAPVAWTLWEGGEPAAWWSRRGDGAVLSERRRGVQVRWWEVAREPLADLPPPPSVPDGYLPGCEPPPVPRG